MLKKNSEYTHSFMFYAMNFREFRGPYTRMQIGSKVIFKKFTLSFFICLKLFIHWHELKCFNIFVFSFKMFYFYIVLCCFGNLTFLMRPRLNELKKWIIIWFICIFLIGLCIRLFYLVVLHWSFYLIFCYFYFFDTILNISESKFSLLKFCDGISFT